MKKRLLSLLILFAFIVTSCGGTPPPSNPKITNPNVPLDVQITGSESHEITTEIVSQDNCTGAAEVESMVEKSRTIQYVVEVQNGLSVNANGQVGLAGTDIELGATVASQLGLSYGESETITRSITVKTPAGMNMQHVIRHAEVWKTGNATVSVGGQQTVIPFKFRSNFAIEPAGSSQIICPANGTTNDGPSETQSADPTQESITATSVMDVQLVADRADGKSPLTVNFDARGSFLKDTNGVIYPCGVCNYTWFVYQNSTLINDPKRSDHGSFSYKFGKDGDYRVVVKVCRGKDESDCGYGAEDIAVR